MTDLQMLGNSFSNLAWYRCTKDLVPHFDPKVLLFENSSLKIMAQLKRLPNCSLQNRANGANHFKAIYKGLLYLKCKSPLIRDPIN